MDVSRRAFRKKRDIRRDIVMNLQEDRALGVLDRIPLNNDEVVKDAPVTLARFVVAHVLLLVK